MKKQIFKVIRTIRKNRSNWRKEEDLVLLQAGNSLKKKKWHVASNLIKTKTSFQCYQRYKLLNPSLKKGKWTPEEDQKLIKLVSIFGKSWNLISKIFKTRSNKQIMNRYEEYLNEIIDTKDFSNEEDEMIIKAYSKFGKNWNLYREIFPNTTIRKIKKRFFLLMRGKKVKMASNFQKLYKDINMKSYSKNNISLSTNNEDISLSPCTIK